MDTEGAHRAAMVELERMKVNMDKMESERAQMVAEVEAQIERALQSMMVGDSDMEWDEDDLDEIPNESSSPGRVRSPVLDSLSSRPISPRSAVSSVRVPLRKVSSRGAYSDGGKSAAGRAMKTFGTTASLAEIADKLETVKALHVSRSRGELRSKSRASSHRTTASGGKLKVHPKEEQKLSGEEAGDEDSLSEKEREKVIKQATKRFSTGAAEGAKEGTTGGDGMMSAVDAGIAEKSGRIAEKMKQIQQRVGVFMLGELLHILSLLLVRDSHGCRSRNRGRWGYRTGAGD